MPAPERNKQPFYIHSALEMICPGGRCSDTAPPSRVRCGCASSAPLWLVLTICPHFSGAGASASQDCIGGSHAEPQSCMLSLHVASDISHHCPSSDLEYAVIFINHRRSFPIPSDLTRRKQSAKVGCVGTSAVETHEGLSVEKGERLKKNSISQLIIPNFGPVPGQRSDLSLVN